MASQVFVTDVQARQPTVQLSLSRVGVTGVEKVIRMHHNGSEQLFSARFECVVEIGPDQKGAHMSRFEEVINGIAPPTHTTRRTWLDAVP